MSYKRSFKNDMEFGLSKEEPVRIILKSYFKEEEDIINTKDLYNNEYCKYDYEGITTKKRYEVKSRTNKKNTYPTTLLPVHKIDSDTIKNGLIFIFNFTDKCCYIKYDKKLFSDFEIKIIKIYREGKYDPPTPHYLIPISMLTDIN